MKLGELEVRIGSSETRDPDLASDYCVVFSVEAQGRGGCVPLTLSRGARGSPRGRVLPAVPQVQVLVCSVNPRHRAGHGRGLQNLSGGGRRGASSGHRWGDGWPSHAQGIALSPRPGSAAGPGRPQRRGCHAGGRAAHRRTSVRPSRPKEPGAPASNRGERVPSALRAAAVPLGPALRLPLAPGTTNPQSQPLVPGCPEPQCIP